ncbi:MAG: metal ABC transporter substrate-binding protein [candidate division Zixibacteria bacterium]|nr:metal ABC transporter substrate-binding protein [candidate division Zixibacteria bacterium]
MKQILALVAALVVALPMSISARITVVTSTSDLAYFAKMIGGDFISVESIASPKADLHYVEMRPSYMVKVRDADAVFKVGLELDMWMDRIVDGSRNNHVKVFDCARYITPMEVPTFKADASYGDLHRFGNPHYWISPASVEPITRVILEGLSLVDPARSSFYAGNRDAFLATLDKELPAIKTEAAPLEGVEIITYHNSWPYFAEYFGIKLPGFIEKYPGVGPSPSHMRDIIDLIKQDHIKVIAMEPYFEKRVPEKIAEMTGATVVTLYPSIGGRNEGESYIDWLRGNVKALLAGIK